MNSDPFSSSDGKLPLPTSSNSVPPASTSTESQETFSAPLTPDDHEGNNEGDVSTSVPSSSPAQQEPRKPKREQSQQKPPQSTGNGSFPTPFKCCGDFCGVVLREELRGASTHGSSSSPSLSSSGAGTYANKYLGTANVLPASTAIQMLFSQDDLQGLGNDNLNCLLTSIHVSSRPDKTEPSNPAELLPKSASSSADLHVITHKSIALAKSNHDQFRRAVAASQRKTYEDKTSTSSNVARKRHLSRLMESTASQESRANSRVRVYGELDGVANYYRQVRVCGDCYAIYALLDMARSLMAAHRAAEPSEAKKQKQRFNKRREEWEQHVEREVQHKEQLYLRKRANKVATNEQSQNEDLILVLPLQQSSPSGGTTTTTTGGQFTSEEVTLPVLLSPKRAPVASNSSNTLPANVSEVTPDTSGGSLSKSTSVPVLLPVPSPSGSTNEPPRGFHRFLQSTQDSAYSSPSELNKKQLLTRNDTFKGMERYLRGESKQIEVLRLAEDQLFSDNTTGIRNQSQTTPSRGATSSTNRPASADISTILLVDSDASSLETLHESLRSIPGMALEIESIVNPQGALMVAKAFPYDLILCERDFGASQISGLDFVRMLRQFEVQKSLARSRQSEPLKSKRTPVVCVTSKTTQTDLQLYKDAGVAPKPRAHCRRSQISLISMRATTASQPQSVPNTFFNLVVVHDLFDTWEKLQILLSPIITRYHGAIQVLVWNYPGQAYTTWRTGTLLNNAYHVQCLHALLQHVNGLQLLRKDAPYYMMGIGNGGNVALKFCVHSPPLDANTRALLLVNAFAFVDASLAQFLHDCLKVFMCTPESRPDLPVYFHTWFLFSSAYLARVSTPLALNLYTTVMNPITLAGRKALCQGALAHAEWTDDDLRRLHIPCVQVCSSQDALVDAAAQAQTLLQRSGLNAVESIGKVLRQRISNGNAKQKNRQSCIISMKSKNGHEATFNSDNARRDEDDDAASKRCPNGKLPLGTQTSTSRPTFEDAFITNVLSTVKQVAKSSEVPPSSSGRAGANNQLPASSVNTQWTHFQQEQVRQGILVAKKKKALTAESHTKVLGGGKATTSPSKLIAMTSWDPTTPAFERLSSNIIYKIGDGSEIYPNTSAMSSSVQKPVPELEEYMAWRVKRNQKRLQRMATQARVIQRAFRAFYARTLILRIKQRRCAIQLQRLWRVKLARKKYKGMKREDWAVRLVQRNWRGKLGRDSFRERMRRYLAAIDIQRIVRGFLAV